MSQRAPGKATRVEEAAAEHAPGPAPGKRAAPASGAPAGPVPPGATPAGMVMPSEQRAGDWAADAQLLSAMGLGELGSSAEGAQQEATSPKQSSSPSPSGSASSARRRSTAGAAGAAQAASASAEAGLAEEGGPSGAEEPAMLPAGKERWGVFAASGKPYLVEPRGGRPGAWVVRDWVMAAPDRQEGKGGWSAPSRARELLAALGWVEPERLEPASRRVRFHFTKPSDYLALDAAALHATGLPPGVEAVAERGREGGLRFTARLDDASLPDGTQHDVTANEEARIFRALSALTGLALDPEGVSFLQTRAQRIPYTAGSGTLMAEWNRTVCRTLFGFDAYERWLTGKRAEAKTIEAPKLALDNYYQREIPGELTHSGDLVESGEPVRFEVQVDWPRETPNPAFYDCPPMVTPGKLGNVALLRCAWRFERIPASAGAPEPSAAQTTSTAEAVHRLVLAPGEASATFRITCEARFDEYFAPTTFTRDVVVLSSAAAMASLRSEAFAGLGASDAARRGEAWSGEGAPELIGAQRQGEGSREGASPSPAEDLAARARATGREQLLAVRAALAANPASADAVAAIDRELARQAGTEKLLAADRLRGWQPFQVRGTYLSRTEGVPSGPLELHGTVHVARHYDSYPGDGPSTTQRLRHDQYVVQLRDLSRRFEQEDFAFEGKGGSFDEALRAAFDELVVAYPKGMVALEAEQLASSDGPASGEAQLGGGTGKVIGFQRSTETLWKKAKEVVWDPVASIAVNLGAIALMTLVPASAPIVAPAILAYNTIPTVDHVASERARGTLTFGDFATAAGEVALNLLPLVGRAKPFTAGWLLVETANWGGQAALMTATAVDLAHQLQAQQVVALAAEYQAFLQLRQRSLPSDPNLAAAEAEIRARAAAVADVITEQLWLQIRDNGIVMVTGSVVHNTSAHVRAAVIERLARPAEPAASSSPAPRGADRPRALGGDGAAAGGPPRAASGEPPPEAAEAPHRTTAEGAAPGSAGAPAEARAAVMLLGDDLVMRELARQVRPLPGYVDVIVHGSTDSFSVMRADVDVSIDQRAFAAYLRKHGLEGQKIRLISCETGKHPKSVAQHLANQLKVEVLAPSDVTWLHSDGTLTIGHRTRNAGEWVPYQPKESQPRSTPLSPLAAERRPRRPEDEVDHQPPAHAGRAHHDQRARASSVSEAELTRLLGAPVVFDAKLRNGVEVEARRVDKLLGFDLEVKVVRLGADALLADALAHASTIKSIERYNGVVGRLRRLADRLAAWFGKRAAAKFPHGSRAWKTQEELTKLTALLTQRHAELGQGRVDDHTLQEEIRFLSGRYAYHEEVLQSLEEPGGAAGGQAGGDFSLSAPDLGRVTEEAEAAGYRLPGADQGVDPSWYYYRHKRHSPSEFELALKPTSPYDAPSLQARTLSGRFVGFEKPERAQVAEIPYDMAPDEVVTHLRTTAGFKHYAEMLERSGLASRDVIDGIVRHVRSQRMTTGEPVTTDHVRHAVKEYFRPRLMERLLDPKRTDVESWRQLRELIDELPSSDRGNLAEDWYRGRYLPDAEARVGVGVERMHGQSAGQIESRVIDAVDGGTAVEVKDISGKLDEDQLGAYLDMLEGNLKTGVSGKKAPEIEKVKYVFTKTEGALANLKMFADKLAIKENVGRLSVEVFDWQGDRHIVTSQDQALQLLRQLTATKGQS